VAAAEMEGDRDIRNLVHNVLRGRMAFMDDILRADWQSPLRGSTYDSRGLIANL